MRLDAFRCKTDKGVVKKDPLNPKPRMPGLCVCVQQVWREEGGRMGQCWGLGV